MNAPKNRSLIIVVAALGVVVAAGLVAFLATSTDSDDVTATTVAPGDGAQPDPVVGETLPVEVAGSPLPKLEDEAVDPAVGAAMPVIDGRRFDGSPVTVGGPTAGPTMYVFLAHWCPHCNDEIPELIELEQRGDLPTGLNVVGISTAVSADRDNYPPSQWIVEKGWPWDVMADDEQLTSFLASGGSGFPYTVLADADGNVLARTSGSRPAPEIKSWLDANLPLT